MFIQIKSTNPDFSWTLNKNPDSTPLMRNQRKGLAFGWFKGEDTYNMCYKENSIKENPYSSDDDNKTSYINSQKYTSCECALGLLANFFSTLYNKEEEKDKSGFENQIMIATPYISKHLIEHFQKHFVDYDITYDKYLVIKSKKKIRELVSLATVLLIIQSIRKKEIFITSNDIIEKYLKCINTIQAPYFIRYLFKVNVLGNRKKFELNEKSINTDAIKMELGSNFQQRLRFTQDNLSFKNSILDFGCGEGNYLRFARKLKEEGTSYYCFDKDKTLYEELEKKIKRKRHENVVCLEDISIEEPVDVILSEVIEHNEKEDRDKIFELLKDLNINSMIITTPNKEFNEMYGLDDCLRHEGHKIEFIMEEFKTEMLDSLNNIGINKDSYKFEFSSLGDLVEGKRPQLILVITKKE